jgi:hypothetical protein
MAMNWTRYGAKVVLDHIWGRNNFAFPANMYLMLSSVELDKTGSLAGELTQGGYARVEATALMGDAVLATSVISNAALIAFGPATEDWPEIRGIGLMDAATIATGNMFAFMPPVTSRVVAASDAFSIRIGQLTFEQK